MKSPVNWIAFSQNTFVISLGFLYHLIRRDSGRLRNEAFTLNLIGENIFKYKRIYDRGLVSYTPWEIGNQGVKSFGGVCDHVWLHEVAEVRKNSVGFTEGGSCDYFYHEVQTSFESDLFVIPMW